MRIAVFKHVDFEGPAYIASWAKNKKFMLKEINLHKGEPLPGFDSFDMLVIMGGPMSAVDYRNYPWLKKERDFVKKAIARGKFVLGICLGAQIMAAALGAKVKKNKNKEIGWFDVRLTPSAIKNSPLSGLGEKFKTFHWHGDTFTIPKAAKRLAVSRATKNQAFSYKDRALALQFHPEATKKSICSILKNCSNEIKTSRYVMPENGIRGKITEIRRNNEVMKIILDNLTALK
jgi:GMP synthase-like glutamine amidotransferase